MLNLKKNLYIASALALCALSACSSDDSSIAGSTTIPNATANNDSNSIVTNDQFTKIVFMTEATSVDSLQGGELKVFEEESGAMAACSADDKAYSSEIQIDNNNMVVTHLKLKNAGNLCEGILIRFSEACGKQAAPWAKCDENGSVETFCGDYRMTSITKCTANNPPSCTTTEADTTITFGTLVSDFYAGVSDICNKISEGAESTSGRFEIPSSSSGKQDSEIEPSPSEEPITSSNSNPGNGDEGNPVTSSNSNPIDTIPFTLENYTAQFTNSASELSFDSLVLAYNGSLRNVIMDDSNRMVWGANFVKEISTEEVSTYFPLTAAVAEERINPDNCKLFIVTTSDYGGPTGHVLTAIDEEGIKFSSVHATGLQCIQTNAITTVAFLVRDCSGVVDVNAEFTSSSYASPLWNCESGQFTESEAYGEWYRADLAK